LQPTGEPDSDEPSVDVAVQPGSALPIWPVGPPERGSESDPAADLTPTLSKAIHRRARAVGEKEREYPTGLYGPWRDETTLLAHFSRSRLSRPASSS
jgi:hypothetical protein